LNTVEKVPAVSLREFSQAYGVQAGRICVAEEVTEPQEIDQASLRLRPDDPRAHPVEVKRGAPEHGPVPVAVAGQPSFEGPTHTLDERLDGGVVVMEREGCYREFRGAIAPCTA